MQGRLRELFGYMTWEGIAPKKYQRKVTLLQRHRFPEIANLASEIMAETEFQRQMSLARREHEFEELESIEARHEQWVESRAERLGEEIASQF